MIAAGRLRHRIIIQSPVMDQDSDGAPVVDHWAEFVKAYAAIEPLSVKEQMASQATQSKIIARIVMRYRPGMNETMRIVHNDEIYNIEGILSDPDSGLEYVTIPVSKGIKNDAAG